MTKTVFADKEKKVLIKESQLPPTGENQVKVKTEYSYISAGTELTILQMGKVNIVQDVINMPLGYSMAGRVIEVGANVTRVKVGDPVACIGKGANHGTEVIVSQNQAIPIPEGCSIRQAAMSAMGCFALEGVRKSKLDFGENVLVVGAGLMGQFVARYIKNFAGRVVVIDRNEVRLNKLPSGVIGLYSDDNVWDKISELTNPTGVEKAFFCLGGDVTPIFDNVKNVMSKSPEGIQHGDMIFSGGATIKLTLASSSGNLRILSSAKAGPGYHDEDFQNGADYPGSYVKWTFKQNIESILQAIADNKFNLEDLITHEYHFEDAMQAYEKLADPNTDALAVLFKYERS